MPKTLTLKIPENCHEDWHSMTPDQRGRFCNSCQKTVVDFTAMTDNQLVEFFKKDTGKVCGRFANDQLNKTFDLPKNKIHFVKYFFKFTFPLFLISIKATASYYRFIPKTFITKKSKIETLPEISIDSVRIIKGIIRDMNGIPIPFATIKIPGTSKGTVANGDGKFNIKIDTQMTLLTITAVGYTQKNISIGENFNDIILVNLDQLISTGIIVVVKSKKVKKTKIGRESINKIIIYPDPVSISSELNISWDKGISEEQHIEIYNAAGKLVQKETIIIANKSVLEKINLKLMQAGMYVIKITDNKTKKSQSLNFIAK